jgi:hypothetical protein
MFSGDFRGKRSMYDNFGICDAVDEHRISIIDMKATQWISSQIHPKVPEIVSS